MKIEYAQNPLNTKVFLDEHEKKELWYKIKIEQYEEILFYARYYLQGEHKDEAKSLQSLDPSFWCTDETSKMDEHVDKMLELYISELQSSHAGDCTCVPMSCFKCQVESLIGVDTMPGLGKHSAYKIENAFAGNGVSTCLEAIEYMKKPYSMKDATDTHSWWKPEYVDRWNIEREHAISWLHNYYEQHLKDLS